MYTCFLFYWSILLNLCHCRNKVKSLDLGPEPCFKARAVQHFWLSVEHVAVFILRKPQLSMGGMTCLSASRQIWDPAAVTFETKHCLLTTKCDFSLCSFCSALPSDEPGFHLIQPVISCIPFSISDLYQLVPYPTSWLSPTALQRQYSLDVARLLPETLGFMLRSAGCASSSAISLWCGYIGYYWEIALGDCTIMLSELPP